MHLIPVFLVVIASMHLKHLHTFLAFCLEEDKEKRNRLLFQVAAILEYTRQLLSM